MTQPRVSVQNQLVCNHTTNSHSAIWVDIVWVSGPVSVCRNHIGYHCSHSAVSAWLGPVQFLDMCPVYRTRWIIAVVTQSCLHGCVLCRFLDMCLYDDEVPRSETRSLHQRCGRQTVTAVTWPSTSSWRTSPCCSAGHSHSCRPCALVKHPSGCC